MSIFIDPERPRPTRAQSSCHMYEDIWASWKDTLENSFLTFLRPKPNELPFEISHCTEITFGMGEDIDPPKIEARRALSDDFSRLWIAPGMTTFWVSIPCARAATRGRVAKNKDMNGANEERTCDTQGPSGALRTRLLKGKAKTEGVRLRKTVRRRSERNWERKNLTFQFRVSLLFNVPRRAVLKQTAKFGTETQENLIKRLFVKMMIKWTPNSMIYEQ